MGTVKDRLIYFVHIISQFGKQDHIRSSRHSGIKGDPAGMMPHHFHNHDPLMWTGSRMQAVDRIRRNIDSRIETERYIRSPYIIIDCFRNANNIQTKGRKHSGCLLCTVSTDTDQTV